MWVTEAGRGGRFFGVLFLAFKIVLNMLRKHKKRKKRIKERQRERQRENKSLVTVTVLNLT